MYQLLKTLLSPYWKWFAVAGVAILALFKARQSGKDVVIKENLEDKLEGVKIRDKIENNIAKSNDSEYERLLKKWTK